MKRERKRKRDDVDVEVWTALREAQRECGCNTATLEKMYKTVAPFFAKKKAVHVTDGQLIGDANAVVLQLHGCVKCNKYVFGHDNGMLRCPLCNHPRFNRKKQPNEVFWYFPLRPQLARLLRNSQFRELLMHEARRQKNPDYIADVYDTPRWRQVAGDPTKTLTRVVYQFCVDAFPWQSRKNAVIMQNPNRHNSNSKSQPSPIQICVCVQGSVKPWQLMILSLPPWLRYQEKFMLCLGIIPCGLKLTAAKKFYDYAAEFEMNSLHRTGVYGVRVIMYGTSLDSPGRRELLAMQSVQAYYPCPTCLHTWQPGLTKVIYGGYRRFLREGHPWRGKTFRIGDLQYEFRDVESRNTPVRRTDTLVSVAIARATRKKPFLGHKGVPLLQRWVGVDWGRSMMERMHDIKVFTEMVLRGLVGRGADGFYKGWGSKDDQHRAECVAFNIFTNFTAGGHPPWRLTDAQRKLMDMRVKSMMWTHYSDKLVFKRSSFWYKTDRIWKAKHKILVLLTILPTCLRGCVAAVHKALLYIVDAIVQLHGQFIAIEEARRLGISPHGKQIVDKSNIKSLGTQLLEGLVMLEGSFPASHLNPAMHHLVHYAEETARVGSLAWISMNAFERNNKRMKSFVRNNSHPEASLANATQVDMAARATSLSKDLQLCSHPPPLIRLSKKIRGGLYIPTRRQRYCMSLLGAKRFDGIRAFQVAWIKGIHFKCGEWGRTLCGSVFTTVYCGKSVYGILDRFMLAQEVAYAAVTWLSRPHYPYAPITTVVRVRMTEEQPLNRCVIRCDRIEPCGVNVMPDEDNVHYYMMRTRGFDRRPQFE